MPAYVFKFRYLTPGRVQIAAVGTSGDAVKHRILPESFRQCKNSLPVRLFGGKLTHFPFISRYKKLFVSGAAGRFRLCMRSRLDLLIQGYICCLSGTTDEEPLHLIYTVYDAFSIQTPGNELGQMLRGA